MNNLYCKSLKLQGFRGFNQLEEINFHKQLNVFFGINGSGKSSILRALSFFLSEITAGSKSTISPEKSDINNNLKQFELKLEMVYDSTCNSKIKFNNLNNLEREEPLSEAIKNKSIPIVVSYSVQRYLEDGFSHDLVSLVSQPDVNFESFNPKIDFSGLIRWLNLEEAIELQRKIEKADISGIADGKEVNIDTNLVSNLDVVRNAIESFTGLSQLSLDRTTDPITLKVRKGNVVLNSAQMSEGERSLLALVGDIAWRLIRLNKHMDNPLNGTGIVLIDEIDLHLHPQWQRTLIPGLVKTFPNIQFILTTHSPQILSQVESGKIYQLKQDEESIEIEELKFVYGYDSNRILEEIMATDDRPIEIKEKLSEIYKMIDNNEFISARKFIQDLQRKIGTDSELDRINMILEHKESLGK